MFYILMPSNVSKLILILILILTCLTDLNANLIIPQSLDEIWSTDVASLGAVVTDLNKFFKYIFSQLRLLMSMASSAVFLTNTHHTLGLLRVKRYNQNVDY